jgi:cell division protein YceG involved in septum cleavage
MKKGVLILTFIVMLGLIGFSGYLGYQYYVDNNISLEEKRIKEIESNIEKLKAEIEDKQKEKELVKNQNVEKAKLLEVWQKELAKVQK